MARRGLLRLIVALVAVPLAVAAAPGKASARDGLDITSTTTYTIDAASGVVRVLVEMTFTNSVPDRRNGNLVDRRYFTGFSLPAPVGAVNVVATSSAGRALPVTGRDIDGNADFFIYDVDFPSSLFYGQTISVDVTYDVTGLPPRSANPSRVNRAYAAFTAFGIGDDGQVTVRVVVPPGFEIDTFGDDATVTEENGNSVYTATDIENPDEFEIFVSARNDDALALDQHVDDAGNTFFIRSWPGDADWLTFVKQQIDDGIPRLEEVIGERWPRHGLEVREAYTPYLYGYAGWFSASDNEIELGEDLDPEVALHELSHAWFNDQWLVDRWLSEGLAQTYSSMVVEQLGGTATSPAPIRDDDPGVVTLNEWGDPKFEEGADAVEDFGYNASYFVVKEITREVGAERMRAVFDAIAANQFPYVGEGEPEELGTVTDWRRFLDLVEEIGGADHATDLFERYVVTPSQLELLGERAATRNSYHELTEAGGTWAPPYVVRRKLSLWSFDDARDLIDDAGRVLTLRDELAEKSAQLGTSYPATFESDYEAADEHFDDVTAGIQRQIDSATLLLNAVAAEAADDGLLDQVGLIGTDLPGLLAEARAALAVGNNTLADSNARRVIRAVERADVVGKQRSLLAAAALLLVFALLATGIVLIRRRSHLPTEPLAFVPEGAAAPNVDDPPNADDVTTEIVVDDDPSTRR